MMIANDYSRLLRKHFRAPHLVLVQTEHTYAAPLWAGRRLITSGKITDRGLRGGREYVTVETWTVDEDGAEVARMHTTALLSMDKRAGA